MDVSCSKQEKLCCGILLSRKKVHCWLPEASQSKSWWKNSQYTLFNNSWSRLRCRSFSWMPSQIQIDNYSWRTARPKCHMPKLFRWWNKIIIQKIVSSTTTQYSFTQFRNTLLGSLKLREGILRDNVHEVDYGKYIVHPRDVRHRKYHRGKDDSRYSPQRNYSRYNFPGHVHTPYGYQARSSSSSPGGQRRRISYCTWKNRNQNIGHRRFVLDVVHLTISLETTSALQLWIRWRRI